MEKKKLKLSISGTSKKTINSIEQAKTKSKNAVLIEKKSGKYLGKSVYTKPYKQNDINKNQKSFSPRKPIFSKPLSISSDFEKRKLAEQRATRRLKGEEFHKETKGKESQTSKYKETEKGKQNQKRKEKSHTSIEKRKKVNKEKKKVIRV